MLACFTYLTRYARLACLACFARFARFTRFTCVARFLRVELLGLTLHKHNPNSSILTAFGRNKTLAIFFFSIWIALTGRPWLPDQNVP